MQRALRWDGLLPAKMNSDGSHVQITPDDIREMKAFITEHRPETSPFDIVFEEETPGDDRGKAASIVGPYVDAGITWWLEAMWSNQRRAEIDYLRTRIRQGPPHVD
jgi:hypothetical protein